jgi:hypothetical protein
MISQEQVSKQSFFYYVFLFLYFIESYKPTKSSAAKDLQGITEDRLGAQNNTIQLTNITDVRVQTETRRDNPT